MVNFRVGIGRELCLGTVELLLIWLDSTELTIDGDCVLSQSPNFISVFGNAYESLQRYRGVHMAAYKHILCNSNFNINNSPTGDCLTDSITKHLQRSTL